MQSYRDKLAQKKRRDLFKALKKCWQCGKPVCKDSIRYCYKHLKIQRKNNRDTYRILHGIPLNAPLMKNGRRPVVDWSQVDWSKSQAQIAREIGVSRSAVNQQAKKHKPKN